MARRAGGLCAGGAAVPTETRAPVVERPSCWTTTAIRLVGPLGTVLALAMATAGCKTRSHAGAPVQARPCRSNATCGRGDYCTYRPGRCGQGPIAGTCRRRPVACAHEYAPVCACDGRVYDNACLAQAAGVDLAVSGGCRAAVPDWIACGERYCDTLTSYCEIYLSDVPELPTDHACRPLPPACLPGGDSPPGCDCFPGGTPCLSFCGPMPTGGRQGFHLTCQGVKPPVVKDGEPGKAGRAGR